MFQVFENDKPCDFLSFPKVHPSWNKSKYEKFEDALCYLRKWLGPSYGGSYNGLSGIDLKVGEMYYYNSMTFDADNKLQSGDFVVIREVN